jgi:hypothetical protein
MQWTAPTIVALLLSDLTPYYQNCINLRCGSLHPTSPSSTHMSQMQWLLREPPVHEQKGIKDCKWCIQVNSCECSYTARTERKRPTNVFLHMQWKDWTIDASPSQKWALSLLERPYLLFFTIFLNASTMCIPQYALKRLDFLFLTFTELGTKPL